MASATCICLMINGFVGFQLYEDGTTLSVMLLRIVSFIVFCISFAVAILTFKSVGLGPTNTIALFIVLYIVNAIFLAVYVVMQLLLVVGTLQERWPLGHIGFGVFFFVIGQVLVFVFSETICNGVQHYMDGLFFATVCNLLAVMMVYKVCGSPNLDCPTSTNIFRSTGTRLPRKISNSRSARNKTTGMSRSHIQRMSNEIRCIKTASTLAACSISPAIVARSTEARSITFVTLLKSVV